MEPVSALAPTFIRLEFKWRRFEALRARLRESTFFASEDDAVLYSQIDRIQLEMFILTKHLNPFEQEKLDELVVKAMREKVLDDAVRHNELVPDEDGDVLSLLLSAGGKLET